jgi:hypothetical protein
MRVKSAFYIGLYTNMVNSMLAGKNSIMLNGLHKCILSSMHCLKVQCALALRSNWSAKHNVQWDENTQPISVLVEKVESRIIYKKNLE